MPKTSHLTVPEAYSNDYSRTYLPNNQYFNYKYLKRYYTCQILYLQQ